MAQTIISKFRIRVYQLPDGSIEVLLGSDQLPDPAWKLLKDQDAVETKVLTDHVD